MKFLNELDKNKRKIFSFILWMIISCCLPASSFGQNVKSSSLSINIRNKPLQEAISEIGALTNYKFFYDQEIVDNAPAVSVSARNAGIQEILSRITAQTNLHFRITNNTITIVRQAVSDESRQQPDARQGRTISGKVTDAQGEPIIGATISVKGSGYGTVSDAHGNFVINSVPNHSLITISYIGYETVEKNAADNFRTVVLREDTKLLDEVVVVGYGTESRRLITNSVGRVNVDDIELGADLNPLKSLQGRLAGVNVASPSGKPGQTPVIKIRGVSSISGNNRPLFVVDGIPTESFPTVNSNDIESMDILKDASAAAIYGSRGNAGVIIITTKKGKQGKTRFDYSGHVGLGHIANDIEVANVEEYTRVMQTAVDNYNVQKGTVEQFFIPSVIQETNWLSEIYRKNANQTAHNISMSGGNEKTNFYTSLGYNMQQGAVRKSNYESVSLRAKFEHKINNYVKLLMNMSGASSDYGMVEDSDSSLKIIRTSREEPPWYSPYNEDGSYKVMGIQITRHNPVMLVNEEDWILKTKQGALNVSFDITPIKGLSYTPSFSLFGILDEERKKITERHDARKYNPGWSALTQQKNVSNRYLIDNILTYRNTLGKFQYSVTAGHSFEKYQYESFGAKSDNYLNGAYPSSSFDVINAGPNIYPGNINYTGFALESYIGRASLNYDNRYILTGAIRRDGSSKFSKESRYGTFPSLSFAWRVIDEPFFNNTRLFQDLKVRLSYGATGNQSGIGNFSAYSLIGSGGNSYNGVAGFKINQDAQNLKWEKTNQFNVGLDAEFLNNRIGVSVDAFYSKTTDLLYNKPVVSTSGYTAIAANIGALQNRGVEFSVNADILTGGFKWNMNGNISYVDNKLLKLLDGQDMIVLGSGGSNFGGQKHALINGKPISAYYMLKMDGIYQKDADVPQKLFAKGVRAGDVRYADLDGDGDISDDDRMYVGNAVPNVFGGITSNMNWKGFGLSIFSQFSLGGYIMPAWRGGGGVEGTDHLGVARSNVQVYRNGVLVPDVIQFYNVSKHVANGYWRGEGTSNTIPRPLMGGAHTGYAIDYNTQVSTRYLEDASFFKIKSVTLSYSLPKKVNDYLSIANSRIYCTLDNYFTFTKYSGYDPEFTYVEAPGHTNYGVDYGELPTLKNIIFGINLTF